MENEKESENNQEKPPEGQPITEFISGLAQLGRERQGIGYSVYTKPQNSANPPQSAS
jgi:hypothetical protein